MVKYVPHPCYKIVEETNNQGFFNVTEIAKSSAVIVSYRGCLSSMVKLMKNKGMGWFYLSEIEL